MASAVIALAAPDAFAQSPGSPPQPVPLLSPQKLVELLQAGENVVFLDVREPEEFAEGHIPGAINMPERDFSLRISEVDVSALVIPYCNMDFRGFVAVDALRKLGLSRLALMQERGIEGWRAQNLPVAGPESGLSDDKARARLLSVPASRLLGEHYVSRAAPTGVSHRIEMAASERYFDPNDLEVAAGDTVHLTIRSEKGNHYFVQPDYELATFLPEGQTQIVSFIADRPGDYRFGSCEWDGGSLQVMKGRLRVRAMKK